MVLSSTAERGLCSLDATILDSSPRASLPSNTSLHALWSTNPAARLIPMLECIARRQAFTTAIAHGSNGVLQLEVTPP
jgi:hypothetical protein